MCCVPALNKLRLAMMAMMTMITMTMKMITKTENKKNVNSGGGFVVDNEEEAMRRTAVGMQVLLRKRTTWLRDAW